jgi:hypothetical protein
MKSFGLRTLTGLSLLVALHSFGQQPQAIQLQGPDRLQAVNVSVEPVTYRGRASMRVSDSRVPGLSDAERFALVRGSSFQDGTIEVDVSGDTLPNVAPTARGFVGIAFRMSANQSHFECFYLRPKNGRSEDQLQRNHSTQYISMPGFPWDKFRAETPGKYESYVDLVPGEWTHVKIVVAGVTARLYVNGASQSALIVNDLKQPIASGAIALWVGTGTDAHFADLKITK